MRGLQDGIIEPLRKDSAPWGWALLAFGLVFSVATQLRSSWLPLGLGECLLLLWVAFTAVTGWSRDAVELRVTVGFVVVGGFLLVAGYSVDYPVEYERPSALHDGLAYGFCAVLALNYARLSQPRHEVPLLGLWYLGAFIGSLLLALYAGWLAKGWTGLDAWYANERWQNLSNNPNQFALIAIPVPFLAIHYVLRRSELPWLPIAGGASGLMAGFYSRSDALYVAWLVGGFIASVSLFGQVKWPRRCLAGAMAAFMLVVSVAGLSEKIWRAPQSAHPATATSYDVVGPREALFHCRPDRRLGEENQSNVRLCLFRHALDAVAYSPFVGVGPGPHSGIDRAFMQEEAHNSWLDFATQAGLVGMVVFGAYLVWVGGRVWSGGRMELFGLLLALMTFAFFHDVLRHPVFWILLLALVKMSEPKAAR